MAQASPNRREPESMMEFVARRGRESVARLSQATSAAAHDAYGRATRTGENLHLPTTDDVIAFGADLMSGGGRNRPQPPPSPTQAKRQAAARPAQRHAARPVGQPSPPRASGSNFFNDLNRNPYVKAAAGYTGLIAGQQPGMTRGAMHMAEDALGAAVFVGRALSPQADQAMNPPGRRVPDQVLDTGKAIAGYADRIRKDPTRLSHDARRIGHQVNVALNPYATPSADTAVGEFLRFRDVGKNHGELALNVALFPVGGEAAAASKIGRAARFAKATDYLLPANGDVVRYLAKDYKGLGHHAILPRDAALPDWLGGAPVPKWIVDSPFNVVQFKGLTQGEAYAKHAMIDKHYYGSGLPKKLSARGWSANKAGIDTQTGIEQVWNGTPEATKSLLGAVSGGAGSLAREGNDGEQRPW